MTIHKAETNGITLAYEELGDPGGRPLLLVMGLGSQMVSWPDDYCRLFVDAGFRVVRYDNRDIGLSTHFDTAGMPDLAAYFAGTAGPPPYYVEDMADDAAGLLASLDMAPAHVVGVSMGGMIVQALAINHPGSVRSMTSIMSTPSPAAGPPTDSAMAALIRPPATTREAFIEQSVETFRIIGSPAYPMDEEWHRAMAGVAWDRDPDPAGRVRQLFAIVNSPDRAPGLAGVTAPSLVIHGKADPLVQMSGGEATAAAIPGAELVLMDGMGHDLPQALWPDIVGRIRALADRADGVG